MGCRKRLRQGLDGGWSGGGMVPRIIASQAPTVGAEARAVNHRDVLTPGSV